MKLIKALNNNVAFVQNDDKKEQVVMGKGVAFNVKPGNSIDASLVEKRFILDSEGIKKDFDSLLKRISISDIELASNIIKKGEERLGYHCNDIILLTLSDHLSMMLQRAEQGLYFTNPLEWDIKLIYPEEYKFAKNVVADLNEKTGHKIPNQEAAFIALHFINSNFEHSEMQETIMCTKIIQNILNITKLYYGKEFSEENFDVKRFITHIRFFVKRQIQGDKLNMDYSLAETILEKCQKDFKCSKKIAQFLKQTYDWDISQGEMLFLTLHLNRMNMN